MYILSLQRFNANRVNIRTIKVFKTIKLETNKSNLNDQSKNKSSNWSKGYKNEGRSLSKFKILKNKKILKINEDKNKKMLMPYKISAFIFSFESWNIKKLKNGHIYKKISILNAINSKILIL